MPRTVVDQGNDVYLDHQGVERETEKAKLYKLADRSIWIPKSQIIDDNGEILIIPRWLAEKNDLESDW